MKFNFIEIDLLSMADTLTTMTMRMLFSYNLQFLVIWKKLSSFRIFHNPSHDEPNTLSRPYLEMRVDCQAQRRKCQSNVRQKQC